MLARLGRWCFDQPWKVILAWIVVVGSLVGVLGSLGGPAYDSSFEIPASDTADGFELLDEHFGGVGNGIDGSLVFQAEQGVTDPEVVAAMTGLFTDVAALDDVLLVSPYAPGGERQVSADGTIAYAQLSLDFEVDQTEAGVIGEEILELVEANGIGEIDGLRVEMGGAELAGFEPPESELLGLAFAVFVLIVAMGSVVAMGTTIGVAIVGVAGGALGLMIYSNATTVPDFATTIGLMIGLGVGIDYALFIVTRYREALHAGHDPRTATGIAIDTAGRSVLFAGMTVVVSLLGLLLIGLAFIAGLGVGAALTVAVVMAASVTLLPAALGLVQDRVEVTRYRGIVTAAFIALALMGLGVGLPGPFIAGSAVLALATLLLGFVPMAANPLRRYLPARKRVEVRDTVWYRLSRTIQARPWAFAIGGTVLLLALTAPVLGLRLGFSDEGNYGTETTTRQAYDLISEGFGPGANGPLILVSEIGSPADIEILQGVSAAINADPGVAFASPAIPNDLVAPQAVQMVIQPTTSPQDAETTELVTRLRNDVIPPALGGADLDPKLTGLVTANVDFSDYLAGRTLLFFGVVLGLSFLLLMTVFRSIMVPLKAVIMNMLSIGAAYGIVVAIFQWGWGGSLFGIEPAPIEPFIPMMMFAIVFGLSMDYEVFLLSRIKEEYLRTGDATNSVADGLSMTARVISAAAAIMVVVFGSFVFEDDRIIKLFGLGLGLAVLIDATLVRMLLVPSTMQLLGARNWWIPGWLDRILPNVDVEGGRHEPPAAGGRAAEPAPWPPESEPEPMSVG